MAFRQAQNKYYKCIIAQMEVRMKGSFKVRCVAKVTGHFYTVGKVYEFKDGFTVNDCGGRYPHRKGMDSFEEWQSFSKSKWELVSDTKEITIRQKGRKVIAVMTEGGKYVESANAKCSPTDEFDFETGAKLAFSRLMGEDTILVVNPNEPALPTFDWEGFKQGKFAVHCDTEEKAKAFLKECDEQGIRWMSGSPTLSDTFYGEYENETCYAGNIFCYGKIEFCSRAFYVEKGKWVIEYQSSIREVKRPAKVGEWIRVISEDGHGNGKGIFEVTGLGVNGDGWVYVNGRTSNIIRMDQYVVLENYQPEATKTLADFTDKELIDELANRWEDKQ